MKAFANTTDYLHCNASFAFYMSWELNLVRVGRGLWTEPAFMQWQDDSGIQVNAVSLSTGFTSTGRWTFSEEYGMITEVSYL